MLITILICWILACCVVENLQAQNNTWQNFIEKYAIEEETENEGWISKINELHEIYENPININKATRNDLEQLSFLSFQQIESILAYIYLYGPMKTLGELQFIPDLDFETRQMINWFVYAGETEKNKEKIQLKNLLKHGKSELITRFDIPLYQRDGYKNYVDSVLLISPNKKYLGNALYHAIKYQYNYANKLYWGITMEKDAGEPFGTAGNWSYDSFGFHFLLKDCGKLKTLALGDYKLNYGEGLLVNTDFSLGKISLLSSSLSKGIKKKSSTNESNFFRGMAAEFTFKNWQWSVFFSFRKLDATLNKDNTISSLKTDGLHRTLLEYSKKNNTYQQFYGANITYLYKDFYMGFTGTYQHYNREFSTGNLLYRMYYPKGNEFMGISTDYGYRFRTISFRGEIAYSDNHRGWATLNRINYRLASNYELTALYRFYSYKYGSRYAASFSESSLVQNESGFYIGLEARPKNYWSIQAYVDFFYFPWPKYQVSGSSKGWDALIQSTYTWNAKSSLSLRGMMRKKEKDETNAAGNLFKAAPYYTYRFRSQFDYRPLEQLSFQTAFHTTCITYSSSPHSLGYLVSQNIVYTTKNKRFKPSLSFVYFHTDDYDSRLYLYERGLLYAYSSNSYFYHGIRFSSLCNIALHKNWNLQIKYGLTNYFDQDNIGSGTQRIKSSSKNDLYIQLRCKF